jgi:protein dpy-30
MSQLPIRAYLDAQLMPLLLEALNELVKSKPQDPIEFIATYMLQHNPEKQ